MAAISITPAAPVAVQSVCRLDITGLDNNTGASDVENYPVQDELLCYLRFVKGGVEYGRSYIFAAAQDGTHSFNDYIFPSSGSWTVTLCAVSDDGVIATQAVTVS